MQNSTGMWIGFMELGRFYKGLVTPPERTTNLKSKGGTTKDEASEVIRGQLWGPHKLS